MLFTLATSAAVDKFTSDASIGVMKLADYLREHAISQTAFAARLGVSQSLIYQWLSGYRPVAADQCPKIERLTKGKVRCEDLNDKVDWAFVRSTAPTTEDA